MPEQQTSSMEGCVQGHIGPLCQSCDIYGLVLKSSNTRKEKFKCSNCGDMSYNIPIQLLNYIGLSIYKTISIRGAVGLAMVTTTSYYMRKSGIFLIGPNTGQDLAIVYVKILLNYLQIINVISQLKYKLFSDLNIFSSVGNPIQSSLTSLDCALKNMDRNIFPIVYIRIIWVVLLYFVYSILISKIKKK